MMMNPIQRVRLIALVSSIAATAGAQSAPPPVAAAPAPATAAAPAEVPVAPAAAPATPVAAFPAEPPAPAAPPVAGPPAAAPGSPPPAGPTGAGRKDDGHFAIGAAWNVGIPVGSVHHFTPAVSGLGFQFLVRYFLAPQVSLGVNADFQTFIASKPRTTYPVNNGALTATAYNQVQNTALSASAHYYFLKDGPLLPYAGASIGVGWTTFQSVAADLAFYDNQASILLGGEVGALWPLNNSNMALLTGFRYSALPAVEFLSVTNVQSLTLQFGVLTL